MINIRRLLVSSGRFNCEILHAGATAMLLIRPLCAALSSRPAPLPSPTLGKTLRQS
jgi:hypothetical protein